MKRINVRGLRKGNVIKVDDALLTVAGLRFSKTELVQLNGRTAAALEISIEGRDPIKAHPDQDVWLSKL